MRISRGFDRPGVQGFATFVLPLILDGVFHKACPRVFGPNTIASLQVRRDEARERNRSGCPPAMSSAMVYVACARNASFARHTKRISCCPAFKTAHRWRARPSSESRGRSAATASSKPPCSRPPSPPPLPWRLAPRAWRGRPPPRCGATARPWPPPRLSQRRPAWRPQVSLFGWPCPVLARALRHAPPPPRRREATWTQPCSSG